MFSGIIDFTPNKSGSCKLITCDQTINCVFLNSDLKIVGSSANAAAHTQDMMRKPNIFRGRASFRPRAGGGRRAPSGKWREGSGG